MSPQIGEPVAVSQRIPAFRQPERLTGEKMKRLLLLATAIVTFLSGVAVSRLFTTPSPTYRYENRCRKRQYKERLVGSEVKPRLVSEFTPLRVTLSPLKVAANKRIPYEHRYAIVENISDQPIRFYVLGFGTDLSNIGASGFMTDSGLTYAYPDLSRGPLMPGQSRMIPIKANAEFSEEAFAWVDYLEFEDGSIWGVNKSRTAGSKKWESFQPLR